LGISAAIQLKTTTTKKKKKKENIVFLLYSFFVLKDHQSNPLNSSMQSIAGILNCLVANKDTNMKDLYDQGRYRGSG
jgi:hypothetical protein